MAPSIETRNLTKRFGAFSALTDLNLKITGAKCVGFLGPNGAGKTTTLKMMTDMIFPTTGEAFLNGISVQRERKPALENCGVLIETPEIYPSLTPYEALEMVGGLRGLDAATLRRRIHEVLAEVKMEEWVHQKVGRFSKGMKQRVNIAAALLADPEIVILDEPSTGLDPRGMSEVRDIVRGLKRSSRLIFMSSHILSEVVDVCDEVALLNRGKLLFYDTLDRVTARFADGAAVAVDAEFARPVSDEDARGRIATLPGVVGWDRAGPQRLSLRIQGGAAAQASVLERLAGLSLGLLSFRESKSALEEVYLREIDRGDM